MRMKTSTPNQLCGENRILLYTEEIKQKKGKIYTKAIHS